MNVVCNKCGYQATHHRKHSGQAMVPDICDRLEVEVLTQHGKIGDVLPNPQNNNLRVRLGDDGPWVDLGVDPATLLTSALETLGDLASKAPGYVLSPLLAKAVDKIRKAREKDHG